MKRDKEKEWAGMGCRTIPHGCGNVVPPVLDMAEKYATINSSASIIEHYFAFIMAGAILTHLMWDK